MSKLCAKGASFFYVIVVLGLVACGGQPVKPEAEEPKALAESPAEEVKPVVEPEPAPMVEVTPQKQADESQIAMEPIPAKKNPAEEAGSTTKAEPDVAAAEAPPAQKQDVAKAKSTPESITAAAAAAVVVATKTDKKLVPTSSGPDHFVVTVGPKEPSHPAYGKGYPMGFKVNGVSGRAVVVERGKSYTFEIVTNPKHDVYISRKAVGWGGAPYVAGVTGAYTYMGNITFKADKETPDQLFYACRNHPYMGGAIHVVNKGQKVSIKQQSAASSAADGAAATRVATVTQSKVKQKLMFAEMMAGSQGAKRVLASQHDEAKKLVVGAKKKLAEGRKKSLVGELPEALALANESLKMLSEASRLVPSADEMEQLAENYKSVLAEIQDYQKSYRSNIKRMEKKGGVPDGVRMDEKKLAATLAKARSLAGKQDYVRANKVLQQAQATMTAALHKMLDSKTIVYDLNFDTPEDEYEYELKRFTGYEELIPVAIEAKKPAAGAIKLMESFLSKARSRRDDAVAKADAGDYPTAIAMLIQATKTVRRALRMVGVSQ